MLKAQCHWFLNRNMDSRQYPGSYFLCIEPFPFGPKNVLAKWDNNFSFVTVPCASDSYFESEIPKKKNSLRMFKMMLRFSSVQELILFTLIIWSCVYSLCNVDMIRYHIVWDMPPLLTSDMLPFSWGGVQMESIPSNWNVRQQAILELLREDIILFSNHRVLNHSK